MLLEVVDDDERDERDEDLDGMIDVVIIAVVVDALYVGRFDIDNMEVGVELCCYIYGRC